MIANDGLLRNPCWQGRAAFRKPAPARWFIHQWPLWVDAWRLVRWVCNPRSLSIFQQELLPSGASFGRVNYDVSIKGEETMCAGL